MEAHHQRSGGDRYVIPLANIQEWSANAPWPETRQIEQDLIICRALCDLFNNPFLAERIAFRGGTAINKILFARPLRYSEDIDLVQVRAEPIGPTIDAIREALAWLGRCKVTRAKHSTHLLFKFAPEGSPDATLNLKVEINTREHQSLLGLKKYSFEIANAWFSGRTELTSFLAEELFGTKLRALLQRRKNRDLFDLGEGMKQLALDPATVVACFDHYLALGDDIITRADAEQRMLEKLNRSLIEDIAPLLPAGVEFGEADALRAFQAVWDDLIVKLSGEAWKSTQAAVEEIRTRFPSFLRA
jgi:predicted nucleotidyltransferase component of viral defense system